MLASTAALASYVAVPSTSALRALHFWAITTRTYDVAPITDRYDSGPLLFGDRLARIKVKSG